MAIIIGIVFLLLCIGLIKQLFDVLKKILIVVLIVAAIVAIFVFIGPLNVLIIAAIIVVIGFLYIRIKTIMQTIHANQQKRHQRELGEWLFKNCLQLGQTSAQSIIKGTAGIQFPLRFLKYTYVDDRSCQQIVQIFLGHVEEYLSGNLYTVVYEKIRSEGMIDEPTLCRSVQLKMGKFTHCTSMDRLISRQIDALTQKNMVDRPCDDKSVLHCVGIMAGANFESEEIELDDDLD